MARRADSQLDADYQRYRQESYKKFVEEFGAWRKNRETMRGQCTDTTQEGAVKDLSGARGDPLRTAKK